jgi:hypothetical protein
VVKRPDIDCVRPLSNLGHLRFNEDGRMIKFR